MVAQPTAIPGMPEPFSWPRLEYFVVCSALPIVYPTSLALVGRNRSSTRSHEETNVALLSLVGFALCLEVASSPSWLRFYAVAMPAVILLAWLSTRCGRWRPLALGTVLTAALYVDGQHTIHRQQAAYVVSNLPSGRAAVPAETDEKVQLILHTTAPGQFFFQAIWPGLYVPLDVRNPLYVDAVATDGATRPDDVARAIVQLDEKAVRYVLWAPYLDRPEPGGERTYHLGPLATYLHARYSRVKALADGEELWERKNVGSPLQSPE